MNSLSVAAMLIVKQTTKLVRTAVVHEMQKSAAGWGLYNDNLFPDAKPEPAIKLHIARRRFRGPKH